MDARVEPGHDDSVNAAKRRPYPPQRQATMIYELGIYHCVTGWLEAKLKRKAKNPAALPVTGNPGR
jgi:hypothetical protein